MYIIMHTLINNTILTSYATSLSAPSTGTIAIWHRMSVGCKELTEFMLRN